MSDLVTNGAFLLGVGFLASGIGWWLRKLISQKETKVAAGVRLFPQRMPNTMQEEVAGVSLDLFLARDVLNAVQDLTKMVATDVDKHQCHVISIHEQIKTVGTDCEGIVALVASLRRANEKIQQQLQMTEQRLQEQTEQLEMQALAARTDTLTNLLNRRGLDDLLAEQLAKYKLDGTPVCIMILDIDHFKKFNDTYGHLAGDTVLRGVGRVLYETSSQVNILGRYGGEEFAVIFPETELNAVVPRADAIRRHIEMSIFHHEGVELCVTNSFGLAQLREDEVIEDLVKRVDEALYASKRAGRNCGHWHDGEYIHPIDVFKNARFSRPVEALSNYELQPKKVVRPVDEVELVRTTKK